jgi:hypothetical protein
MMRKSLMDADIQKLEEKVEEAKREIVGARGPKR